MRLGTLEPGLEMCTDGNANASSGDVRLTESSGDALLLPVDGVLV